MLEKRGDNKTVVDCVNGRAKLKAPVSTIASAENLIGGGGRFTSCANLPTLLDLLNWRTTHSATWFIMLSIYGSKRRTTLITVVLFSFPEHFLSSSTQSTICCVTHEFLQVSVQIIVWVLVRHLPPFSNNMGWSSCFLVPPCIRWFYDEVDVWFQWLLHQLRILLHVIQQGSNLICFVHQWFWTSAVLPFRDIFAPPPLTPKKIHHHPVNPIEHRTLGPLWTPLSPWPPLSLLPPSKNLNPPPLDPVPSPWTPSPSPLLLLLKKNFGPSSSFPFLWTTPPGPPLSSWKHPFSPLGNTLLFPFPSLPPLVTPLHLETPPPVQVGEAGLVLGSCVLSRSCDCLSFVLVVWAHCFWKGFLVSGGEWWFSDKRTSLGCWVRSGPKRLWRKQSQSMAERSWTCILYGVGCVDKNALQAMLSWHPGWHGECKQAIAAKWGDWSTGSSSSRGEEEIKAQRLETENQEFGARLDGLGKKEGAQKGSGTSLQGEGWRDCVNRTPAHVTFYRICAHV